MKASTRYFLTKKKLMKLKLPVYGIPYTQLLPIFLAIEKTQRKYKISKTRHFGSNFGSEVYANGNRD